MKFDRGGVEYIRSPMQVHGLPCAGAAAASGPGSAPGVPKDAGGRGQQGARGKAAAPGAVRRRILPGVKDRPDAHGQVPHAAGTPPPLLTLTLPPHSPPPLYSFPSPSFLPPLYPSPSPSFLPPLYPSPSPSFLPPLYTPHPPPPPPSTGVVALCTGRCILPICNASKALTL